ncbi:PTS N-acetyl-D-glucosamine transporter [Caulobacter sp. CCUG 60055]|nr:N-acetylglucosamine-specific PTS transporter subunit IIBC [Caulobacter sp. CCUG 60055]MCI3180793.1 PTS N-acetyl-D-glucosamine transporter [Caulobacter sp. CCUG 60055]
MKSPLAVLQPLGRALMLPIAVLPVAGLLLRLGQHDLLNVPFIAAAGDAIFSNLGLLFAIGVAVGFARENNGAAGLAGVVCFLVATKGAETLIHAPPELLKAVAKAQADLVVSAFKDKAMAKLSVPLGILSGLIGGTFYNRFSDFKLPEYLAFFGGRRFVPIISGVAGLVLALAFGAGYDGVAGAIDGLSRALTQAGDVGLFVYGVLNRVLILTGLHHILNNVAWFILGDYHGATGDLNRFFAGDPSAGKFMSGFFPVMMFGLPAACLAMYHAARPERRKAVGGMLLSMALTAFLTGVTEPIEFSFMFLAPPLFAIHAALTGLAMALMDMLHVRLGFGFSAGLFDYVLNFHKSTRPWVLLPFGVAYGLLYYGLFRWAIRRFDLKTPGREAEDAIVVAPRTEGGRGEAFAAALGGSANLATVDACTTRLRLVVRDQAAVDEAALKGLGARGVIRPSAEALQVVLGPIADQVAGEIRARLAQGPVEALARAAAPSAPAAPVVAGSAAAASAPDARALLAALGGPDNLRAVATCSSRLRLTVVESAAVDEAALRGLGVRGVVKPKPGAVHVLIGPAAEAAAQALRGLVPAAG